MTDTPEQIIARAGLAAALVALAKAGIEPDIQELLMLGNPSRGIGGGALLGAVKASIAALDAAGYVVLPKEPTEAMTVDGGIAFERSMFEDGDPLVFDGAAKCYRAMLATAREPSP